MSKPETFACEVCGLPATHVVQDALEETWPYVDERRYRPLGPPHYFCDRHARSPVTHQCTYWHCRGDDPNN